MADTPLVGIVMGSDSDLEVMTGCIGRLKDFGIAHEVRIISAHRTPDAAAEYSATAEARGLKVIIAAAGMSAALPGVLAAGTTLPVIGVPMAAGPLVGVDAALSILQMPPGVAVGAMAIGSAGAQNAAIYAAQILAVGDTALAKKLVEFKRGMVEEVAARDKAIQADL
jgi:5-(carboxyamino)imidazole ribonucleotide mutase